jgi:hypothetical protein
MAWGAAGSPSPAGPRSKNQFIGMVRLHPSSVIDLHAKNMLLLMVLLDSLLFLIARFRHLARHIAAVGVSVVNILLEALQEIYSSANSRSIVKAGICPSFVFVSICFDFLPTSA